ncbi:MbeB family mobilization protein, partial [Enterobacter intestinihominis]
ELSASARRISDAILAHEQSMSEAMEKNRRSVLRTAGRTWLTILMVSAVLIGTRVRILWWEWEEIREKYTNLSQQEDTLS